MPEGTCSWNNTKNNPDGLPEGFVKKSLFIQKLIFKFQTK
jgi:hypothetical protein